MLFKLDLESSEFSQIEELHLLSILARLVLETTEVGVMQK